MVTRKVITQLTWSWIVPSMSRDSFMQLILVINIASVGHCTIQTFWATSLHFMYVTQAKAFRHIEIIQQRILNGWHSQFENVFNQTGMQICESMDARGKKYTGKIGLLHVSRMLRGIAAHAKSDGITAFFLKGPLPPTLEKFNTLILTFVSDYILSRWSSKLSL